MALARVVAMDPALFQVWFGNIPVDVSEAAAIEELRRNDSPRPTKLIIRTAGSDGRPFAIGHYRTHSECVAALHSTVVWSSGETARIRTVTQTPLHHKHVCTRCYNMCRVGVHSSSVIVAFICSEECVHVFLNQYTFDKSALAF